MHMRMRSATPSVYLDLWEGRVEHDLVSRGHTPFRKRGKGSGNFFYSSLLPRTVECGTNHNAVFCHMSAVVTTSIGNYKV